MKKIKTRNSVKGIKALDKSAALSTRMKDAFIRTKERAEETQNLSHHSPDDYASSHIQDTAQGAVQETIHHFPNPRQKIQQNIERAKGHFQEVKRQTPKERQRTAEQARQTVGKAKSNAEKLQKNADRAANSAQEAKTAVQDAKQVLREVRQSGRQTLRDVKQNVGVEPKFKATDTPIVSTPKSDPPRFHSGVSDFVPKSGSALPNSQPGKNPVRKRFIKNSQSKIYRVKNGEIPRPNACTSKMTPQTGRGLSTTPKNTSQVQSGTKPQKTPSFTTGKTVNTISQTGKPLNASVSNPAKKEVFRPNYLNKGVYTSKSADRAVKPLDKSTKTVKSATKSFKDTSKGTIKTAKKSVKTAEKSAKAAVKTAQRTAKTAQKTAQTAAKAAKTAERTARAAAKAAVYTAKAATKTVIAMVKAAIAAIKGLVALIAAGGWVAVAVILIICLIGLLVGSVFGIFFSSEPDPRTGKTVNGVIAEINAEYTVKIDNIISSNAHDLLDMSGARAAWKQVLAVYTVKTVTDPDNPMEVATMDDAKAGILQTVFWNMNTISYAAAATTVYEDVLGDNGLPTGETIPVTKTVLRITVTHKTADEMTVQYGFNNEQKEWLAELLKPEYHSLWNGLLYGITSIGDGSLIAIADTQIGNIGGEPYWRWYGFNSHVAWCACFVSWCADQCGYIDAGIIPRFSLCDDGKQWFKNRSQWQSGGYTPVPGDIIFFNWDSDGSSDHVGIVERVEGDYVHTIEGNTSDSCARRSYQLDSEKILGYGVPIY